MMGGKPKDMSDTGSHKVQRIKRFSGGRSSMNNILRKIPGGAKLEKLKREEEKNNKHGSGSNSSTKCDQSLRVPQINDNELKNMRNYPSYLMGRSTKMTSKLW